MNYELWNPESPVSLLDEILTDAGEADLGRSLPVWWDEIDQSESDMIAGEFGRHAGLFAEIEDPRPIEFTVGGFGYTHSSLTAAQENAVRDIVRRLPPFSKIKEIVIVGHSSGTRNLEMHANRRATSVFESLARQLDGTKLAKVRFGTPVTKPVSSASQSSAADRKVVIHIVRHGEPSVPSRRTRTVRPLTQREIKFLVWGLIGEKPNGISGSQLVREFLKFVDLQELIKKPTIATATKAFLKTFSRVLIAEFKDEPQAQWGSMIGMSYALMDVATRARSARTLTPSASRDQETFARGFAKGYAQMRTHMRALRDQPQMKHLLKRLSSVNPRSSAMRTIYRALVEVSNPKLRTMKSQQFFAVRQNCRFRHPQFKVGPCQPT